MKIFAYRVTGASVFSRFDRSTTNRPPGEKKGGGRSRDRPKRDSRGKERRRDVYIQSEVERKSSRGLIIVIQKKKKKEKPIPSTVG